jgi:Raf kinase inhibitor-like YbhB/YbcL family protein
MKQISLILTSALLAIILTNCSKSSSSSNNTTSKVRMEMSSPSFPPNTEMPVQYTCDQQGGPVHPALNWSKAPSGSTSFVVVMQDNDFEWTTKDKFVHWLMYDIASTTSEVPEGTGKTFPLPDAGTKMGINDYDNLQYDTPCPPAVGETHNYQLKVFALDKKLGFSNGKKFTEIRTAIAGHILDSATYIFKYTKK